MVAFFSRRIPYTAVAAFLIAAAGTGCRKAPLQAVQNDGGCKPAPGPNSYYRVSGHSDRVIVFVHGIFGSSNCTWRYSKDVFWPDMIAADNDPVFRNADVYLAGYDNPALGNRMTVGDIVSNLNGRMESDGVFQNHREVIIVAHSLGGIVAQKFLTSHTDLAGKVPFIYFYGTPHAGSQIAKIGHVFSANPLLLQMFATDGDNESYLTQLEEDWRNSSLHIRRYCAVERASTDGVMVVDKDSATRSCDEVVAMPLDHVHLVKPDSTKADPYINLKNALHRLQSSQSRPPVTVTEPVPAHAARPHVRHAATDPCKAKDFDDRSVTCNG